MRKREALRKPARIFCLFISIVKFETAPPDLAPSVLRMTHGGGRMAVRHARLPARSPRQKSTKK
ncbi:MAG: hypothetical protein C3F11_10550 [Methylocystaceae bacterium]|nr:MAG: hypothetical protein C3F11_10550 [Methylocystaceae bacterium]